MEEMTMARMVGVALAMVLAAVPLVAQAAGDPVKGKQQYGQCRSCHSLNPAQKGVGPSLAGVMGRKVGTFPGFKYSADYVKGGFAWDEARMIKYLADPKKTFPSSKMTWKVKDPAVAANIVAFLKTNPKP
jgi:cytochrome c